MATYRKADADVTSRIKALITANHPELEEAGVKVGARFAFAPTDEETGEPKTCALKHHGYPAAAIVRIVSQKDRSLGFPDAIVDIDGEAWLKEWSEERKSSVLDHELLHLEVKRDEDGAVQLDDCNRPKLKMRLHDFEIGGFEVIAKRYGSDAIEVAAAQKIADEYGNLLFNFAAGPTAAAG